MLFLKHKQFRDVCIRLYNYNLENSNITIYGEYWNLGINVSHRIGEYIAHNMDVSKLKADWEMWVNTETGRLPKLRNANWFEVDFELLKGIK